MGISAVVVVTVLTIRVEEQVTLEDRVRKIIQSFYGVSDVHLDYSILTLYSSEVSLSITQ
jgi:hypothetical protein